MFSDDASEPTHWKCAKCTFPNTMSATHCDMCNHPRSPFTPPETPFQGLVTATSEEDSPVPAALTPPQQISTPPMNPATSSSAPQQDPLRVEASVSPVSSEPQQPLPDPARRRYSIDPLAKDNSNAAAASTKIDRKRKNMMPKKEKVLTSTESSKASGSNQSLLTKCKSV